ncbi:hypothetical protein BU16DRAFT_194924 [Lophium mytilinum]|uniref:Uncharacterized protein n=1 Tax=Lophium mytilinum TaxID=390894 RepID=A0A6A6R9E8_9PEZI|nr:hypothetical protein BU16DRAFT_194924 [Lophium mytilinum]
MCTAKTLENLDEVVDLFETGLSQIPGSEKSKQIEIERTLRLLQEVYGHVKETLDFLKGIKPHIERPPESQTESPPPSSDLWEVNSELLSEPEVNTLLSDSDGGSPGQPEIIPKARRRCSLKDELRDETTSDDYHHAVVPTCVKQGHNGLLEGNSTPPEQCKLSGEHPTGIRPTESLEDTSEPEMPSPQGASDIANDSDSDCMDEQGGASRSFQDKLNLTSEEKNQADNKSQDSVSESDLSKEALACDQIHEDNSESSELGKDVEQSVQNEEEAQISDRRPDVSAQFSTPTSSVDSSDEEAELNFIVDTDHDISQNGTLSVQQQGVSAPATNPEDAAAADSASTTAIQPQAEPQAEDVSTPQNAIEVDMQAATDIESIVTDLLRGNAPALPIASEGTGSQPTQYEARSARCPKISKKLSCMLAMACLAGLGLGLYYFYQLEAPSNEQVAHQDSTNVGYWRSRGSNWGRIMEEIPMYCRKCDHDSLQEAWEQRRACGRRFAVCSPSFFGMFTDIDTHLGWLALLRWLLRL